MTIFENPEERKVRKLDKIISRMLAVANDTKTLLDFPESQNSTPEELHDCKSEK